MKINLFGRKWNFRIPIWRDLYPGGQAIAIIVLVVLTLGPLVGIWAFSGDEGEQVITNRGVDLIREIAPVSAAMASVAPTVDQMVDMTTGRRGEYLRQNHPHLHMDFVRYLRDRGDVSPDRIVDRVHFFFGTLEGVQAEDSDGVRHDGYVRDQLLAIAYIDDGTTSNIYAVECANGIFADRKSLKGLQLVGEHTPVEQFTIHEGQGLMHYVGFQTAITIAERCRLPVYRGRRTSEDRRITYAEARSLEQETDRVQITVYVQIGDRFDLRRMQFKRRNDTFECT